MPFVGVRVQGLRELQRAFAQFGAEERRALRSGLAAAAEPVRVRAEELALADIDNMRLSPRWAQMRIGVTQPVVYVAPRARRRQGSPRPNLAGLLMGRSMEPALDQERDEVVSLVDQLIGVVVDAFDRG